MDEKTIGRKITLIRKKNQNMVKAASDVEGEENDDVYKWVTEDRNREKREKRINLELKVNF